jgi:hypothetical protein
MPENSYGIDAIMKEVEKLFDNYLCNGEEVAAVAACILNSIEPNPVYAEHFFKALCDDQHDMILDRGDVEHRR